MFFNSFTSVALLVSVICKKAGGILWRLREDFCFFLFSSAFFTFDDEVLIYQIHTIRGGHKEMSLLLNEDKGEVMW